MKPAAALALFAGALALVLAGGYAVGATVRPDPAPRAAMHDQHGTTPAGSTGHGGHDEPATGPGGLSPSTEGFTLEPAVTTLPSGTTDFRFTVTDADGKPLTRYTPSHEKDLHLIVVRRDLTRFQHVHPLRDAGGTWSVPLSLRDPGPYRVYADFVPEGHDGALILATDVTVPGDYRPEPLPPPATTATAGDYGMALGGELEAGKGSAIDLTLSRGGKRLTDLQPYLGAYGHLVALREGDLAYLHVHPEEGPAGPTLAFVAEVPSRASYRLFLDFRHDGQVRTVALTARAR